MFVGGFVLFAAAIVWAVGLLMSPHGESTAEGTEHVKNVVVVYLRNTALATVAMSVLAAYLLFPARRPKWPARDWTLGALIALLIGTSLYQLVWLQTSVL